MQRVVWTETVVEGPKPFDGVAGPAAGRAGFLPRHRRAGDAGARRQRPDPEHPGQGVVHDRSISRRSRPGFASLPAEAVIPRKQIVDLTAQMSPDGKLAWDVPPGQVARPAAGPHDHRQGQSSRAGVGPRAGVRQVQQGGGGSAFQRPDGPADRRESSRWPARARCWCRRTSTVGKSARRTGRRGCARSSSSGAATICCRSCRRSPAAWWTAWKCPSGSSGTCGRRSRT